MNISKFWKNNKTVFFIGMFIFILTIGVRLYDLNGAGGAFDEYNYLRLAINTQEAFSSLDFSKQRWSLYKEHPALGKYIHALFYYPETQGYSQERKDNLLNGRDLNEGIYRNDKVPGEMYRWGRYSSVLMGGFTVLMVFIFCLFFFNKKIAMMSGLFLAVIPNFITYHKIASLDAATSFFFTMGVLFFALAVKYDTWKWWLSLGVVSGLGIATKFSMVFLFLFYIVMFLIWKIPKINVKWRTNQSVSENILSQSYVVVKRLWYWKLFFVPIIALIILYISWPWLWTNPIGQMSLSLHHFDDGGGKEPWFGQMKEANVWYYVVYFIFTTPELLLVLFVLSFMYLLKNRTNYNVILVYVWFAIPFLWSFLHQVGDGMRYLTMIYPALAIIVSLGLCYLFENILKRPNLLKFGVLITFFYLVIMSAWIHPYYVDYYNTLIGGPKNVQQNNLLEFGWFGEGLKETTDWLNENAEENAVIGAKWNPPHDIGGLRKDLSMIDLIYKDFTGLPKYLAINHRYYQYDIDKDKVVIPLDFYDEVHVIDAGGGAIGKIYKLNEVKLEQIINEMNTDNS